MFDAAAQIPLSPALALRLARSDAPDSGHDLSREQRSVYVQLLDGSWRPGEVTGWAWNRYGHPVVWLVHVEMDGTADWFVHDHRAIRVIHQP